MVIKNNQELIQAVKKAIDESGYKKSYISEQLGISRQAFSHFLQKSNFSIDDANKILKIIGYKATANIDKNILQKVDKNSWQKINPMIQCNQVKQNEINSGRTLKTFNLIIGNKEKPFTDYQSRKRLFNHTYLKWYIYSNIVLFIFQV